MKYVCSATVNWTEKSKDPALVTNHPAAGMRYAKGYGDAVEPA